MTAPDSTDPAPTRAPEGEVEYGPFVRIGARLGRSPHGAEYLVGGVLATAAVILTGSMATDMWFGGDELEYLTHRSMFDLGDLTRPVGGHWTTWTVVLLRGTYSVFGVEWWPWYFLPRLIGHTLLVTLVWRVIRRRGADPLVGIVAYAVLLVLGASGYQRGMQIGNWVVYAALIAAAWIISRRPDRPTTRDRALVAGALLFGVLGNGYAVAVLGGLVVALLLARRIRPWIPALAPAIAAYVAWWLTYRNDIRPKPKLTLGQVLDIPSGAFGVMRRAVETATALPQELAGVVVVALVAWVISLIVRRRLDLFDAMILWTLAIGLSLLTVQRIAIDPSAAESPRYGYSVSILAVLALVPHIRLPRTRVMHVSVLVVGCALVLVNANEMRRAIEFRTDNGRENVVRWAVAAELMKAGETVVAGPSTVAPGLETDELRQLIDVGYDPDPLPADHPDRARLVTEVRGSMRMNLVDRAESLREYTVQAGLPPTVDVPVDAGRCVLVEDEPLSALVIDAGSLSVRGDPQASLQLSWTDEYGTGTLELSAPHVERSVVELADPPTTAELRVEVQGGAARICGLARQS